MIDHRAALLALRTKALTTSVVTTGSATLTATATGFTRASGSFVTDGFLVGMEVTGTGFTLSANNGAHVVTAVATLTLTCSATSAESAATATLAVGLPSARAWENIDFTPTAGAWYVEEDYLPGPAAQVTLGNYGQVETFPTYVLKLYGPSKVGVGALYALADAVLDAFVPRTAMTLSTGDTLVVRTDPAPFRGQLLQADGGWAVVSVTVPCRSRSPNTY